MAWGGAVASGGRKLVAGLRNSGPLGDHAAWNRSYVKAHCRTSAICSRRYLGREGPPSRLATSQRGFHHLFIGYLGQAEGFCSQDIRALAKYIFIMKKAGDRSKKGRGAAVAARAVGHGPSEAGEGEMMKRLTIDISSSLHRRIKTYCAANGLIMADEIRAILDEKFPEP